MHRFWLLIVVLFGLASASGPTMASAVATGHFWTAATPQICAEEPGLPKFAALYKPCPKKINGQAVPCQQVPAVMPKAMDYRFEAAAAVVFTPSRHSRSLPMKDRLFRPPQTL